MGLTEVAIGIVVALLLVQVASVVRIGSVGGNTTTHIGTAEYTYSLLQL
jgi:hypothetical protein